MSCVFEKMTVFAPAKVNLHLAVMDRRQDGFHNLESLFLRVNFGDFLHFQPDYDGITDVVMNGEFGIKTFKNGKIDKKDNIIFKAAELFRKLTGFHKGVKISVDKKIPVGGGLGGGSSDAASALSALNKIAGCPLNRDALLEAAARLGSDVPFFIHETAAAWVTGRGEIIKPVEAQQMFLTLVNPGFQSETAAAFRLLDEQRKPGIKSDGLGIDTGSLKNFSFNTPHISFFNDFLPVFKEQEKSKYMEIISQLRGQGAVYANLSGAGSTCFGVFNDEEQAKNAADVMRGKWEFSVFCPVK